MWSKDVHDHSTRDELAKSVAETEKLLELHQERKVREGGWLAGGWVGMVGGGKMTGGRKVSRDGGREKVPNRGVRRISQRGVRSTQTFGAY